MMLHQDGHTFKGYYTVDEQSAHLLPAMTCFWSVKRESIWNRSNLVAVNIALSYSMNFNGSWQWTTLDYLSTLCVCVNPYV
jgi:hypothetical protein